MTLPQNLKYVRCPGLTPDAGFGKNLRRSFGQAKKRAF
jgi:hypothetical protein